MKIIGFKMERIFLVIAILILGGTYSQIQAQEVRSYQYDNIDVQIQVNKDSTFDVVERQTYNYSGEYHQGWRSIPLDKISAITGIQVIDGATNQPLVKSSRLNKNNPASWGHYTTYKENGNQNIEWYYNLKDTTHTWIIKYKVHGGIGFYQNHDEVYWNVFTNYSVPVLSASARVVLPTNNFTKDEVAAYTYAIAIPGTVSDLASVKTLATTLDGGVYDFSAPSSFAPHGKFTIAAGWPKGLIEQKSFWIDWFSINWAYFLSLLIIFSSIIYYAIYWYLTERYRKGRGTIIPQYEPPMNLRPAMAQLVATENINRRTWPATIVDLAVRGHVVIKEEEKKYNWFRVDYLIEKTKNKENDDPLEDYEARFLRNLFDGQRSFSTSKIKNQLSRAKKLSTGMDKLAYDLYKETDKDTKAYEVSLTKKRSLLFAFTGLAVAVIVFFALITTWSLGGAFPAIIPVATLLFCFWALNILIKNNPRLNKSGFILKEEWLGFKMYLEKAEKYRLQNLTPDLFEKYLPYAMIFGIEKKWAKNFDSLNMKAPTWYVSSSMSGANFASSSFVGGGFSATAFSSSFSTSFSSAFSGSSGIGGGGVGGGGGAGGGGGGGGGGAS